jgi:hypothetical protein
MIFIVDHLREIHPYYLLSREALMSTTTNGTQSPNLVVGVYSTLAKAESAVRQLEAANLSTSEISVISSSEIVKRHFEKYRPNAEPDDWKKAAVLGGSTGAVLAGLTSVAALVTGAGIPVVLAGGLASFLTGGVVGSLAGVMTERGFESEAADYFELAVADGKTLIAVDLTHHSGLPANRAEIERILIDAGSEPVQLHKNPDFASK